jgi:hypothetical protein
MSSKQAKWLRNFKQALVIVYGNDEAAAILEDPVRFREAVYTMNAGRERRQQLTSEVLELEGRLIGDSKSQGIGREVLAHTLEKCSFAELRQYRDDLSRLLAGEEVH